MLPQANTEATVAFYPAPNNANLFVYNGNGYPPHPNVMNAVVEVNEQGRTINKPCNPLANKSTLITLCVVEMIFGIWLVCYGGGFYTLFLFVFGDFLGVIAAVKRLKLMLLVVGCYKTVVGVLLFGFFFIAMLLVVAYEAEIYLFKSPLVVIFFMWIIIIVYQFVITVCVFKLRQRFMSEDRQPSFVMQPMYSPIPYMPQNYQYPMAMPYPVYPQQGQVPSYPTAYTVSDERKSPEQQPLIQP